MTVMDLGESFEVLFQDIRKYGHNCKLIVTFATLIGLTSLLTRAVRILLKCITGLRLYVFSRFCCQVNFREKYGQWAVISGATDGIGLAMAKELARRGMSIVVIGRNEEKLAATKVMLEKEANVGEVVTVKIDLSDSSLGNFEAIRGQIDPDNRDIGLLVNNAGTFPGRNRRYASYEMDYIRRLANLNILSALHLTKMILPGMLNRRRGLIVNVSSIAGTISTPYSCVYGATKSFVDAFSRQLQIEYSGQPVDVVNLTPGMVSTKLVSAVTRIRGSSLFIPTADYYASNALDAISTGISWNLSGTLTHGLSKQLASNFKSYSTLAWQIMLRSSAKKRK